MKKRNIFRITVGTVNIGPDTKKRVIDILASNRLSSGRYVEEFEKKFAGYHRVKSAIAVDTGTAACTIALAVLHDIAANRGDEVIVPALTFIATSNAVIHAGFTPVFADVDRDTYNIDPAMLEKAITPKTKAIMPVHLFGRPADMKKILDIARVNNLYVVEDASEAHGALYHGKKVGTFGELSAFSFYVAHIVTTGEGGAIITNDEKFASLCRSLRAHGRACKCKKCVLNISSSKCPLRFKVDKDTDTRFFFERIGYSSKMNEIEAAIGLEQVEMLDEIIKKRRSNMNYLNKNLKAHEEYFNLFKDNKGEVISPLSYPVLIKPAVKFRRRDIVDFLEGQGIETRPMFSSLPTQQPAYKYLGYKEGQFPNAEYIGKCGFYIGIHQDLKRDDLDFIADTIKKFIKKKA